MERNQSRTTDFSSALGKLSSSSYAADRDSNNAVNAGRDAVMLPAPRIRNEISIKGAARDDEGDGLFVPSESLRDQLLAIRRRLWIVNATLESLPAKIEQTYRNRSIFAGTGPNPYRNASDTLSTEQRALESQRPAGWWARWKLARLKARARRAEARAASALYDASVSFGEALEAILQAAVARVKADEAAVQSLPLSFSAEIRPRQ